MNSTVTAKGKPCRIREKHITFGSNGIKLRGQVLLPENASADSPVPGVVLCHGFGSSYRQTRPSARLLAQRGIATLIFDMRGHCSSEGIVDGKMVDDIVDAWQVLKDYPEVDEDKMGLAGHSLGAMSAIMAAEKLQPKALVALSSPPQLNHCMLFEVPQDFGHWGQKRSYVMKYPQQGAFPWLSGLAAWGCRAWMYLFGYTVKVDLKKFITSALQMNMKNVLADLKDCSKLFVHCAGDSVTPWEKLAPVYETAAAPKDLILSKGGLHTTPLMSGQLRLQWVDWLAEKLKK
ncbi:MAG TPA: alpha/beta fold hydrolase [Dehalococcoidia bacterium]|nr:alpha/beta fold hydrolase [Dehalococcoidia bacterium]